MLVHPFGRDIEDLLINIGPAGEVCFTAIAIGSASLGILRIVRQCHGNGLGLCVAAERPSAIEVLRHAGYRRQRCHQESKYLFHGCKVTTNPWIIPVQNVQI